MPQKLEFSPVEATQELEIVQGSEQFNAVLRFTAENGDSAVIRMDDAKYQRLLTKWAADLLGKATKPN